MNHLIDQPDPKISIQTIHSCLFLTEFLSSLDAHLFRLEKRNIIPVYFHTVSVAHLEGLHEGPQQDADGVALPQQLDETSRSEQSQEAQVDHLVL